MAVWWAVGVAIVTFVPQFLLALLVLRLVPAGPQSAGILEQSTISVLAQAVVGILILWVALGLRPDMTTRRRIWLSLLGLVPFWGTLVAIAAELFIERQHSQERSPHL